MRTPRTTTGAGTSIRWSTSNRGSMHVALIALFGLIALLLGGCARETSFPSQPISLICPWSAGGGTDRMSRQIASQLERELGVPVNVINATGGSGVTGHTRGAVARPDGYTLTMITVELNMLHWRGLTTVSHEDFAPLVMLNRDSAALFVRDDSPYETLGDLESAIAEEPGTLKSSGTAYGGIWHVAMAGWLDARGLDASAATWISINGAGPSLQELIAGGVDVVCCSLPEADALLAGGQVRCLGVMAEQRLDAFPEVPTFPEQGHDWVIAGWRGLAAPKETPPDRLSVLTAALDPIVEGEELSTFMENAGFNRTIQRPEAFAQTLAQQDELFRDILTGDAFRDVREEHFGVMIFPATIGIGSIVVLLLVMREVRQEDSVASHGSLDYRPPILVLVACVAYLLASEWLGFVLTAFGVLAGLMLCFRARPAASVVIGAIASVVTYQVFAVLLRVPLPRGLWGW